MTIKKPDRLALVTGGGGELGRAFCLHLAVRGWHVVIVDCDTARSHETLSFIENEGGTGQVEILDISDQTAWHQLREKLQQNWEKLDLFVNNAGICASGQIGEMHLNTFMDVINTNLLGIVYGCNSMVPWMKAARSGGHIINIASITAMLSFPAMGAYNVSKAGVMAFSETLYSELRPEGIGVTVVLPGFFPSGLLVRGVFAKTTHRQMAERITAESAFTAEDVVRDTMNSIKKQRLYVVVGQRAKWFARFKRLAPTTLLRYLSHRYLQEVSQFEGGK